MRSRAAQVMTGPISDSARSPGPTLDAARALGELVAQRIARIADRDDHRHRHAALAGRAVAGADQRFGGEIEIGVGHDHRVVLGAAQRLHALAMRAPVS